MYKEKLVKKLLIASMPVVMALSTGSLVYANTQALPNGTITSQNGTEIFNRFYRRKIFMLVY